MVHESLLTKYFHHGERNYKNDQSHKEAWCKACVAQKVCKVKHLELVADQPEQDDAEVEKEGKVIEMFDYDLYSTRQSTTY